MRFKLTHRITRLHGLLTAEKRAWPDFFIIGAQKGGTSSLFNYLGQHPELAPSYPRKEINYFENPFYLVTAIADN